MAFDLFRALLDPEDFRPQDFARVERVAVALGVEVVPSGRIGGGSRRSWRSFRTGRPTGPRRTPGRRPGR